MNSQPRKLSAYADTKKFRERRTVLRYPNRFVSAQADSFRGCEFIRLKTKLTSATAPTPKRPTRNSTSPSRAAPPSNSGRPAPASVRATTASAWLCASPRSKNSAPARSNRPHRSQQPRAEQQRAIHKVLTHAGTPPTYSSPSKRRIARASIQSTSKCSVTARNGSARDCEFVVIGQIQQTKRFNRALNSPNRRFHRGCRRRENRAPRNL